MNDPQDPIFKLLAEVYAERCVGQCKESQGNPALLADAIAAHIDILERAVNDARKVGNEEIASVAVGGAALLREAALHLPVRSLFLHLVLARKPPLPFVRETSREFVWTW